MIRVRFVITMCVRLLGRLLLLLLRQCFCSFLCNNYASSLVVSSFVFVFVFCFFFFFFWLCFFFFFVVFCVFVSFFVVWCVVCVIVLFSRSLQIASPCNDFVSCNEVLHYGVTTCNTLISSELKHM